MSFSYLPLFTGDYLRDTRHLSPLRHGVYLLSLMYCWDSQGPMPLDEQECAGICNCRSADEVDALRYVIARYFVRMDDGHYNKRMTEEVAKSEGLSLKRSHAGLKSANVRRAKARIGTRQKHEEKALQLVDSIKEIDHLTSVKHELESPSPSPSPGKDLNPNQLTLVAARPTAEQPQLPTIEAKPEAKRPPPDCPHVELLALWADVLPAMPQHLPDQWRGTRADHLRARWRETAVAKAWPDKAAGLVYFRKLLTYVGQSAFLTGRATPAPGKRPFFIELEWLVNPTNWAKVHEGKYHPENTK